MRITVHFTDGTHAANGISTKALFEDHRDQPTVTYHEGFVEIRDTYGARTSYPAKDIVRIETEAAPRSF